MKILLSGAKGNLGRAISAHANFELVELNREDWTDLDGLCSGASGGTRNGSSVNTIIHGAYDLSARVEVDPESVVASNIMSTARLLMAAKKHGISRFCYVSSCAVYGEGEDGRQVPTLPPTTPYGKIKKINEMMIHSFCEANKIQHVTCRVFNLYGGNDKFSILHHLEKAIHSDRPFVLNNGGQEWRDFIHVDDAARAIVSLATGDDPWNEIDVGTGEAVQIADIVSAMQRANPRLRIVNAQRPGPKYSCADAGRIGKIMPHGFISLPVYLTRHFQIPDLMPASFEHSA
ncbi:MAG: SDR family oxidoreductase [Proteobacteria bacterium]|nr:SDR family oxidoreductase [Pseudomonadota bacterium]